MTAAVLHVAPAAVEIAGVSAMASGSANGELRPLAAELPSLVTLQIDVENEYRKYLEFPLPAGRVVFNPHGAQRNMVSLPLRGGSR
jgi:hypothetical protein